MQHELRRNSETSAAAAAGPIEVGLGRRIGPQDPRLAIDHADLLQTVAGQAVRPSQQSVAATHHMTGYADGGTTPGLQRQALGRERLVDLVQRNAGTHRHQPGRLVDRDRVQSADIDHDIDGLREAFIGMAAAPDRKVQRVGPDPVDHHGDGMFGLADRTQRRAEPPAQVSRRKIIGVVRVRRPQEQYVTGGKIWQRR